MSQIDISGDRRADFTQVLADATGGTELIYHIGEFAAGPHKSAAMTAATGARCFIYQRRVSGGIFAYIAKKPKRAR